MEEKTVICHNFSKDVLANEELIVGIDEAGRGPVIGPMIFGIAFWLAKNDSIISKYGFNDSKQLKHEEREEFYKDITDKYKSDIGYGYISLSAKYISSEMLKKYSISLNDLSFQATSDLLCALFKQENINIKTLIVDAVGNCDKYQQELSKNFPQIQEIKVLPKADALFKVVGAASIVAKVQRDRSMLKYGCSGYPSDKATVDWLKKNFDPLFGFNQEVRFSWKTVKKMLEREHEEQEKPGIKTDLDPVKVRWREYKQDEDQSSLNTYFAKKKKSGQSRTQQRSKYFKRLKVSNVCLDEILT